MAKSNIKPGWVLIASTRPRVSVLTRLDADTPQITGGYGGWSIVDRPRRVGATVWEGREPRQMELKILLDGFKEGNGIAGQMATLEKLALPQVDKEPPKVFIDGPGIQHTSLVWVIQGIEWGDAVFDQADRDLRTRQHAVLSLLAYSAPDRLATGGAAAAARRLASQGTAPGTSGTVPYVVKQSDISGGLAGIAARKLGAAKRWVDIAKLNNIRDPKNIKVGQRLRMPPK